MESIAAVISGLENWSEVRVRWRDAHAPHSGWHEVDEYIPEDATAVTLGRVWQNCQNNYLTLVGTVFEYDGDSPKTVGDINHIPIAWILDVELIRRNNG